MTRAASLQCDSSTLGSMAGVPIECHRMSQCDLLLPLKRYLFLLRRPCVGPTERAAPDWPRGKRYSLPGAAVRLAPHTEPCSQRPNQPATFPRRPPTLLIKPAFFWMTSANEGVSSSG